MRFRALCRAFVCLGLVFSVQGSLRAQEKIELKVVKYPGLADTVRELKGKVAVVDFWADF